MTPEKVREELDQAPSIDTAGVSDRHGEVLEAQSRDLTRALEGGDDESDENDGDYVPEEGEDKDKEQSEIEYNDFDESGADDYYNLTKGTERGLITSDAPGRLAAQPVHVSSCIRHGR